MTDAQKAARRAALDEVVAISEELGTYDTDLPDEDTDDALGLPFDDTQEPA